MSPWLASTAHFFCVYEQSLLGKSALGAHVASRESRFAADLKDSMGVVACSCSRYGAVYIFLILGIFWDNHVHLEPL